MSDRRQTFQRPESPRRFRLTKRDIRVLRKVWEYRFVTTSQLQRLEFWKQAGGYTALSNVRNRLRLLYDHAFLERVTVPMFPGEGRPELVYCLGEAGVEYLESIGIPADTTEMPSGPRRIPSYLEHELLVAEFMSRMEEAIRQEDLLELKELDHGKVWYHERTVVNPDSRNPYERYLTRDNLVDPLTKRKLTVKPDAVFVLRVPREDYERLFFIEIDRDTMGTRSILDKQLGYHLFAERDLHRRYGEHLEGFRVLFITSRKSTNLNNLMAEMAKSTKGVELFTFAQVKDTLQEGFLRLPLWRVPGTESPQPLIKT